MFYELQLFIRQIGIQPGFAFAPGYYHRARPAMGGTL
jgi:hypothetical protein